MVCWQLTPVILATWETDQEDCGSRATWANRSRDPHLQNNQSKNGLGGVDQVVECEALSSKPVPLKQTNKKQFLLSSSIPLFQRYFFPFSYILKKYLFPYL
jgi:hypothetical protein